MISLKKLEFVFQVSTLKSIKTDNFSHSLFYFPSPHEVIKNRLNIKLNYNVLILIMLCQNIAPFTVVFSEKSY